MHIHVFYKTQTKLIAASIGTAMFVGLLSLGVGVRFINTAVLSEATSRISQDLNSADEMYDDYARRTSVALQIAASAWPFAPSTDGYATRAAAALDAIASQIHLDFAGFMMLRDGYPRTNLSVNTPFPVSDEASLPAVIRACVRRGEPVSGTALVDPSFLMQEGADLADRARTAVLPTPKASPRVRREMTDGMTIMAAVPVESGGQTIAIFYGGILLNKNREIVDRIRETVFRQEVFRGINIGTVTIFQDVVRISTNVMTQDGRRAIGTAVSEEVQNRVLEKGLRWTGRAFVVSSWYISAYDPIVDVEGRRVGMLYVGVLEEKYSTLRRRTVAVFTAVILSGVLVAVVAGFLMGRKIMRPVNRLIAASNQVADGELSPDLGDPAPDELGVLQKTFAEMLQAFRRQVEHQERESRRQLLQSEKQANVGRLAAGVAHEINNPLASVLTFAHLLLERDDIPEDAKEDLRIIAGSTDRARKIIRGLLDFSRQGTINPTQTDVNDLVQHAVRLLENQARSARVDLRFEPHENIPEITVDYAQIQSVLVNLIMNAIDACSESDEVTVTTGIRPAIPGGAPSGRVAPASRGSESAYATSGSASDGEADGGSVEIAVADTGHGIPPENMEKLFSPFFTTKETGEGTGLGLAVSAGIVEQHKGTIQVESRVGEGTVFRVLLPVSPPTAKPTQ